MPKRLHRRRGVGRSLRRLALSEIDDALAAIGGAGRDPGEAVHAIRQGLKRLRALIRLPHGHFRGYARENLAFRDLARSLAGTREAEVLGRTYDEIVARAGLDLPAALRGQLIADHGPRPGGAGHDQLVSGDVVAGLHSARSRVERWHFGAKGLELIADGLKRTYRQMRSAGLAAMQRPEAEVLHAWRKQVKYHAAQLRMLADVDPPLLETRRRAADELADVLGEHHDLDLLRAAFRSLPDRIAPGLDALEAAIAARCTTLETEASRLGDQLGAEPPRAFRKRLADAWQVWRN